MDTYLLGLAGEYRVCSELLKRGILATITYGNSKGVDLYVFNDKQRKALRIEVKTSQKGRFVTGISQKYKIDSPDAPDFWVLFNLCSNKDGSFDERFFVLSHKDIWHIQEKRNDEYARKYRERHGKEPDLTKGVDNVTIEDVLGYKDRWGGIVENLGVG